MAADDSEPASGAGTFVLIFALIAVAWAATWLLPQGAYQREIDAEDRVRVVAGTYERLPAEERIRLGPQAVPAAIPLGLERARGVLFFILIVGGAFRVLRETGAAEAAIGSVLRRFGHRRDTLLFAGLAVFAAGSSTIGMAEEYLPFVPILVIFGLGLGLDRTAAVGIIIIGSAIGYGTAAFNPFTVVIAQEICELRPLSGMWLRLALVLPFLLLGFDHLRRHARRLERAGEQRSDAAQHEKSREDASIPPLTGRRIAVLGCLVAAIGVIVFGMLEYAWYLNEMMALFLVLTIAFGIAGGFSATRIAGLFGRGAAELAPTGLLIGFAYSVLVVLERGQVVDTVIYAISLPLEHVGGAIAAGGMLLVQSACNVVVPSGSGQAGVTMPIMASVADLTGVSRQTAVLAFQLGDGLTNMIIPTNVVMLGMLTMAGVSYGQWVRFIWPLVVRMLLLAMLALMVAVWIGYS